MLDLRTKRAALLVGLSAVVLAAASPSHANTVMWGASRTPDIIAPEPAAAPKAKNAKKSKAAKPKAAEFKPDEAKPAEVRPAEAKPAETTASGFVETLVTPFAPPKPRAAKKPTTDTAAKGGKGDKGDKTDQAMPVVPPGPLHIVVSVDAQRASLYANGELVASTKVSTGTKSHPTPMGVFSVIQKNRHHVSNLYGAPMPYMQRLTWSGTAMHTGPLPGYPASHGCIRLTNEFAQLLWKATRIGARVIVTREDIKPADFAHARLFARKPAVALDQPADAKATLVRTADATGTVPLATAPDAAKPAEPAAAPVETTTFDGRPTTADAAPSAKGIERRTRPVSIFISRKDGKLYVRQGMEPLFDMPITVGAPDQPIGTHVYTAMEFKDGAMRWTAMSIPSGYPRETGKTEKPGKNKKAQRAETTGTSLAVRCRAPTPRSTASTCRKRRSTASTA